MASKKRATRKWTERPCRRCGVLKPRSEFAPSNGRDDKRRPYCVPCWKEKGATERKRCPNCKRRDSITAWAGLFCPKCRPYSRSVPGAQKGHGEDLTETFAQACGVGNVPWMQLTQGMRNAIVEMARRECERRNLPGFGVNRRGKAQRQRVA
jgi:hypothetical protein